MILLDMQEDMSAFALGMNTLNFVTHNSLITLSVICARKYYAELMKLIVDISNARMHVHVL